MTESTPNRPWPADELASRLVRYEDLVPCTTAFLDTRTPGSDRKENFTIIGPGVAENPDQHVHIEAPHGFNVGAARQPPGCVNSQHSHETAEVFIVHSGRWAFQVGERGDDAEALLAPGDSISIPTRVFRGFTNVGEEVGFMFAVLGEDDPGRVTWAPSVFAAAEENGMLLLENGGLVDRTLGQEIPAGLAPMPPTTRRCGRRGGPCLPPPAWPNSRSSAGSARTACRPASSTGATASSCASSSSRRAPAPPSTVGRRRKCCSPTGALCRWRSTAAPSPWRQGI